MRVVAVAAFNAVACVALIAPLQLPAQQEQRYLYVAAPSGDADADRSIRVLVFDIADSHRFVKRLALWQADVPDERETVRGIAAGVKTGRLFISTTRRLAAIDLKAGSLVWERATRLTAAIALRCRRTGRRYTPPPLAARSGTSSTPRRASCGRPSLPRTGLVTRSTHRMGGAHTWKPGNR